MLGTGQSRPQVLRARLLAAIGLALAIVLACPLAQAQTFTVLYTFTDETEGWQPDAAPILDTAGNLYGTTQYGGTEGGFGTVFELDTTGHERVLYSFAGEPDGEDPVPGWWAITRAICMEQLCMAARQAGSARCSNLVTPANLRSCTASGPIPMAPTRVEA